MNLKQIESVALRPRNTGQGTAQSKRGGRAPRRVSLCWLLTCCCLAGTLPVQAALPPAFEEVSGLVRSNLAGATPEQLDQAAVEGFLKELGPRVVLVDRPDAPSLTGQTGDVVDARIYRSSVAYIRLGGVDEGSAEVLLERYQAFAGSNQLSGLVLDLRRAAGEDYASALKIADLFLTDEVPLINWGEGLKRSTAKQKAIALPVAVLLNNDTGGAAEALAAMLRQSGVALLIGSQTAGTAGIQRAFPLENGQFLRITVANVQLGNAQLLTASGLKPDVEVTVSGASERSALSRETKPTAAEEAGETLDTNGPPARARLNEADLGRRWRGEVLPVPDVQGTTDQAGPESKDPALLRALDLMEGLAILRSWQLR